jgi:hypothetical protein
MRHTRKLALLGSAALAATTLTVAGSGAAARADTPFGEIRTVAGAIGGPFSGTKCLDLRRQDGVGSPYARIQQWDCSGANEQQFRALYYGRQPGGYRDLYQMQSLRSGQCVEVRDGLLTGGAQIDQYPCDTSGVVTAGNARQLWQMTRRNATAYYRLQPWHALSAGANMCMDVKGAENSNGVKMQLYVCNGTVAQEFFGTPMVNDGHVYG